MEVTGELSTGGADGLLLGGAAIESRREMLLASEGALRLRAARGVHIQGGDRLVVLLYVSCGGTEYGSAGVEHGRGVSTEYMGSGGVLSMLAVVVY